MSAEHPAPSQPEAARSLLIETLRREPPLVAEQVVLGPREVSALRILLAATAPPSEEELHQEAAQFANAQTGSLPGRNDAASMAKADKRQWDRAGEDPWLLIGRDYIAGARREGAR
jgi:hypothetical protein